MVVGLGDLLAAEIFLLIGSRQHIKKGSISHPGRP